MLTDFADRPVPRLTEPRASPISPCPSPTSDTAEVPSWPAFCPQHFTCPLSSTAQFAHSADEIPFTVRFIPNWTGSRYFPIWPGPSPRTTVSPAPKAPCWLSPQHLRTPFADRAQDVAPPSASATGSSLHVALQ